MTGFDTRQLYSVLGFLSRKFGGPGGLTPHTLPLKRRLLLTFELQGHIVIPFDRGGVLLSDVRLSYATSGTPSGSLNPTIRPLCILLTFSDDNTNSDYNHCGAQESNLLSLSL